MAQYGTLRDFRFGTTGEDADDIRGSSVYGLDDDKLGKIDDVIFDHSSGNIRYVIVDTGGWLRSRKFLVPADRLRVSAQHEDDYQVDLTKQQIESFPPYDENDVTVEDRWTDYESRYRQSWPSARVEEDAGRSGSSKDDWEDGEVLHKKGSDRIITPEPDEITASGTAGGSGRSADLGLVGATTGGADTVTISNSAAGIGGRWDTFQQRLRERRKEVVTGVRPAASAGAVTEERKAS